MNDDAPVAQGGDERAAAGTTMRIAVVTLFAEMFAAVTAWGVTGRAVEQGRVEVALFDPRDDTSDRHRTVDDRPYGGGPGMLMKVAPLRAAIARAQRHVQREGRRARVIYLSPQGRRLDQAMLRELAGEPAVVLVAGRYEGIDERLVGTDIDEEWSIGDYVLSGGELAAMVVIDGVSRLLPGVLGHAESAGNDSFADGLLDHPHYTRPAVLDGQAVPAVLLSGDHGAIRRWRRMQALGRTVQRRPDLLAGRILDRDEQQLLAAWQEHRADVMSPRNGGNDDAQEPDH